MCLHELSIVDDTLEALSAKKEYQWLRKWIIRIIIGWIVYIFCQLIYFTFIFVHYEIYETIIWKLMLDTFLGDYASNIIILSTLISATILGLVLYICVHLICKLLLLKLCVKMFTERNT